MNAIDLIHAVPEVEKHLSDEMSRQIYKIRLNYSIYRNVDEFFENIAKLNIKWLYEPDLDEFFSRNVNAKRIVIFGAGERGRYTLTALKHYKYKDLQICFCDSDSRKWKKAEKMGGGE